MLTTSCFVAVMLLLWCASAGAVGDANEANCPNEASPGFRTYLPDCRAYELVTPPNKQGARVRPLAPAAAVAANGSSVYGQSNEAFAGFTDAELPQDEAAFYRFARTGSEWQTTPLNPPRSHLLSLGVEGDDSVWTDASAGLAVARLSLARAEGSVSEIGPVWSPALGPSESEGFFPFAVQGVAGDAARAVVFEIEEPSLIWSSFDDTIEAPSLYMYRGLENAAPSLVGVSGGAGSTALISQCGTALGSKAPFITGGSSEYNAVSESGQVVFFTAAGADTRACGGIEPPANELFARVDGL